MTEWEQLSHRVRTALDRLAWGFGDLKRVLIERGAWPARAISAVTPDGTNWSVTGTQLRRRVGKRKATTLLLPESECLWGTVELPPMHRKAVVASVNEALWRVSPLPPDQIVAGWRAEPNRQGGWFVNWGICRRAHMESALLGRQLPVGSPVYLVQHGRAVAVPSLRASELEKRQRWMDAVGFGVLIAVVLAVALPSLMPLILKRQAVVLAVEHVRELEPQAAPLRQQLDELRQQSGLAEELRKGMDVDMPLASVINGLSMAMPSDTWLDRIEVNGREIRVSGLTNNAAELIAHLARQTELTDVRATAANVRDSTVNKERFSFEMHWRGDTAKQ